MDPTLSLALQAGFQLATILINAFQTGDTHTVEELSKYLPEPQAILIREAALVAAKKRQADAEIGT